MASSIKIFTPFGLPLTEIDADFERSWLLNKYGTGTFTMALTDSKATKENLGYGNLVLVEHPKLPPWLGTIEPPRKWGYGVITVNCFSVEFMLTNRICGHIQQFVGTPGNIFKQMIELSYTGYTANSIESGLFKTGTIYAAGTSTTIVKPYIKVYDAVLQLTKDFGNDFDYTPVVDTAGKLSILYNWYKQLGTVRTDRLIENKNIKLEPTDFVVEQGEIVNSVVVYGDGSTWTSRPIKGDNDIDSQGRYRFRAKVYAVPGMTQAQATTTAAQYLKKSLEPRKTYKLTVLDDLIEPEKSIFYNIRIGDTLTLDLYGTGFTGEGLGLSADVRVRGMSYKDSDNQLGLVCDEEVA
jgi:hypothetical protein